MRLNKPIQAPKTAEGGKGSIINDEERFKRAVLSCMLWEDNFYEDGISIASRIAELTTKVSPEVARDVAIKAKNQMKLRHVPLWVTRAMLSSKEHSRLTGSLIPEVIQRADELPEFLSMYWKDGKRPIAAQVKKGLAQAFTKFDEYQLGKYDRKTAIKLRDVMFLVHPKPKDEKQAQVWKRLVDDKLKTPDTWEVAISKKDANKTQEWSRLLANKKLGTMALIRNLRNMIDQRVDEDLVRKALREAKVGKTLPFRFIAAQKHAPRFAEELENLMLKSMGGMEKLDGRTVVLVDVSGSMEYSKISGKSEMRLIDAANGLAILLREVCEDARTFAFSNSVCEIPPRRGFALSDAIRNCREYKGGTQLGTALDNLQHKGEFANAERVIIITDEQIHDGIYNLPTVRKRYIINVAPHQVGVGYGHYTHINGFSEGVVDYIREYEKMGW